MPKTPQKLSRKQLHNRLKHWLIELGKEAGYESFSGDSEPIDIRVKRSRIEYKPDVVWNRRGKFYFLELAFTEDWRSVIGEFILASLKRNSRGFFVIRISFDDETRESDYDLFHNLFKILSRKEKMRWAFYLFTKHEITDFDYVKRKLKEALKEYKWL